MDKKAEEDRERQLIDEFTKLLESHDCADITDRVKILDEGSAGNGSFGSVYRGELDGKRVAIKCLDQKLSEKDLKTLLKETAHEIHALSKANHPNVLRIYGLVRFKGLLAIVTPWVDGGTVAEYQVVQAFSLCAQIAKGVAYLHSIGVMHGDIKEDNALVTMNGTVLLSDLGGAKVENCSLELSGKPPNIATPAYMAPERRKLPGPSKETDVYALGMTIARIASQVHSYDEANLIQAIRSRFADKVAQGLVKLLQDCWQDDPALRPNAQSVHDRLLQMMSKTHWPNGTLEEPLAAGEPAA